MVSGHSKDNGQTYIWSCHKHGTLEPPYTPDPTVGGIQQGAFPECPTCKDIAKKDLCRDCEKHPASVDFAEGTIAYIHGMTLRICLCCYLAKIEETLKNVQANREQVLKQLQENPCDPYEPERL